jgi:Abnormal spindle-like microcephaly-assoc'd, ASPM-SPD-2-Hydin
MKVRLFLAVLVGCISTLSVAQSGTMSIVPGLNTVQYSLNPTATPDPTIAVGTLQFCEHVNSAYQCWWKSGANALQPVNFFGNANPKLDATIWSQNGHNFGNTPNCPQASSPNAQILHDNVYNVWIIQKRISIVSTGLSYMCIAISNVEDVSQTSPVAFSWFAYEFLMDCTSAQGCSPQSPPPGLIGQNSKGNYYYPDYPQAGLWQTSTSTTPPYTPATDQAMWITYDLQDPNNNDATVGVFICAVDIAGLRASTSNPYVNNSHTPACTTYPSGTFPEPFLRQDNWVPAGNSDTTPPISSDGEMFTYMVEPPNDGHTYLTTANDTQEVQQWKIDWSASPPTPTFENTWQLASTQSGGDQLACFHAGNFYDTVCIPQPSTSSTGIDIDSVGDRMQQLFHYTSNNGMGGIWTSSHTIEITPNRSMFGQTEADLRILQWNTAVPPVITVLKDQTVTDPNDPNAYVTLPSFARDKVGNLQGIIGTSGPGATEHPGLDSIYYIAGTSSIGSYGYIANPADDGDAEDKDPQNYRWGDWQGAVLDPSDSCTVWVVGEFLQTNRMTEPFWYTQIARLPPANNCTNSSVSVSTNSLTFVSQEVGTTSAAQNVTLFNDQAITLSVSSIGFTGADPGDFSQTNTCMPSVPADGTCTISVTFTPSTTGSRTATLNVTDGAGNSPQTVSITGTGVTGPVTLSPNPLSFPTQAAGTSSSPQAVTLTNSGGIPLTINSIAVSGGFTETNGCLAGVLEPSTSCTIDVTFSPALPNTYSGELTISDSAPGSPQVLVLSGTALIPLVFTPANLTFGNVTVGTNNGQKTVTFTNQANTTLNLTFTASGNYAVAGNGKIPCGSTLQVNGSCTVGITFTPTNDGTIKGAVSVAYNAAFSPQQVGVQGVGVNGSTGPLTFSVGSLTFSNVPLGTKSVTKNVTVTNSGTSAVNISSVVASGDYIATVGGTNPCGGNLAAGAKCGFTVNFQPTVLGSTTGSVSVYDNQPTSPQVLNLSANSVLPATASPPSLLFSPQTVGTTSASQTVTVSNNLNGTITLNSIVASGDYVITPANINPCGSSLLGNTQCNVGVAFSPTVTGSISGTLTITTNTNYSPATVTLNGTGQ